MVIENVGHLLYFFSHIIESPCNYISSLHWLDGEVVGGAFHERVQQVCSQNTAREESTNQITRRIGEHVLSITIGVLKTRAPCTLFTQYNYLSENEKFCSCLV